MNIVDEKFKEWTSGASEEDACIRIFENIRDLPYAILPVMFGFKEGPEIMLRMGKGFCDPKHYLLGRCYDKLKIPVRYSTYIFKWEDLPVEFPERVKALARRIKFSYHLALQAFIDNRWITVDVTWDLPLKQAGFKVNENWDGKSDTHLAVNSRDGFLHKEAAGRNKFMAGRNREYSLPEKLAFSRFSIKLNEWLDEIRKI